MKTTMLPPLFFVGHATVLVELAGMRVLTDPLLRGRVGPLRRVVRPVPETLKASVDVVLVSHAHHDHLDVGSLRRLGADVPIVVPCGVGSFLRARGFAEVVELAAGASLEAGALTVTATDAAHDGRRLLGPRGQAVGYLLEGGGRRIYFAGDTDLFPGMGEVGDRGLDVALLPVWGWGPSLGPGHLDPRRAAEAVARLRPAVAVPVHWGTYAPVGARRRMRRQLAEPPQVFAAAVADRGLATRVEVTRPGAWVGGSCR